MVNETTTAKTEPLITACRLSKSVISAVRGAAMAVFGGHWGGALGDNTCITKKLQHQA